MNETLKETLYFAFISYSHKDEKIAEWLTKELEHFQIPTSLIGAPRSLRPIFRDNEELSAGNLPEQISKALAQSRNLIVICSPSAAKSKWVDKEIQDFIRGHNGSAAHVFPFIIDGDPYAEQDENECYPPSLRRVAGSEERLGVHIKKDSRKKISLIRLIAGMLGVGFDSLWQRHEKELRRKRITRKVLSSIIVIAFLFFMGALWLSRRDNLATQSRTAAELAEKFIQNGDYVIAKRLAMAVLPRNLSFPIDRPFVSEASEALFHAWEKEQQSRDRMRSLQVPVSQFHTPKIANAIAINPDGTHVVTAAENLLCVLDSNTGEQVGKPIQEHSGSIYALAFSHDGEKMISAGVDDEIILWDFFKRKPLMRCVPKKLEKKDILIKYDSLSTIGVYSSETEGGMVSVKELVFSPDDRYFASLSQDGLFRIWDAQSGEELSISPEHEKHHLDYKSIVFNQDATKIITGDSDGSIRIWGWNGDSLHCNKTIPGESGAITAIAFNHSGTQLVSVSYGREVIIRDAMSYQELSRPTLGNRYSTGFMHAWFTADDKILFLADSFHVYLIDPETGEFIQSVLGADNLMSSMSWAPDGVHFVSSSKAGDNNTVSVWNLLHSSDSVYWKRYGHQGDIVALTFNDRGTLLASGADDKRIVVWDPQTGAPLWNPMTFHDGKVTSLSFNPQGNLLVSMASDKRIIVWDLESEDFLCEIPTSGEDLSFVGFSDSNTIASHGDFSSLPMSFRVNAKGSIDSFTECRFSIFDIGRDTLETETIILPPHLGVTVSDNLTLAANLDSRDIYIYSAESGKQIACLKHSEVVTEVFFGKKGRKVITFSPYDHSLRVWDIKREQEIMKITVDSITNVAMSLDERFLAIAFDSAVQIWDVKKAAKLLTVHCSYGVDALAISPDGGMVAVGSGGAVSLYYMSIQKLLDKTRHLYPPLITSQKKQYNLL